MPSIFQSIQLTVLSCSCGITYAIPEENRLEREGRKIVEMSEWLRTRLSRDRRNAA